MSAEMASEQSDLPQQTETPAEQAVQDTEQASPGASSEFDSQPGSADTEPGMPDPASIVVMASMHLQTEALLQALVTVFDAHAWRSMGLVADHTGEVRKDLPSAQMAIDSLAFVLGKIDASLDDSLRRDVQRRLADLRMNYVNKVRESQTERPAE